MQESKLITLLSLIAVSKQRQKLKWGYFPPTGFRSGSEKRRRSLIGKTAQRRVRVQHLIELAAASPAIALSSSIYQFALPKVEPEVIDFDLALLRS